MSSFEVSRQLIKKVLSQENTEDGWVNLGTAGKQFLNLYCTSTRAPSGFESSAILSARQISLTQVGSLQRFG
ncbi:hypothetical protein [Sinorhizobium psoraleae]|uniref:hypothetical protein n=1 Tax=Sinorhizobium psoraleae TaxID=520838 RepID=UPI0015697E4F|nr:hypothetical protein [Sinorhizobium psoraleae]